MSIATSQRPTPAQVAREWAKRHADFTGEILVDSATRKGKGGWGRAGRTNRFFALAGRVAADRENRRVTPTVWNGLCQVCGRIYIEQVLTRAWASDPEAGREAAIPASRCWEGWEHVVVADAYVTACPDCIKAHGLRLQSANGKSCDSEPKTRYFDRPHPELARHQQPEGRVRLTAREL
jgi:hypothetical protein